VLTVVAVVGLFRPARAAAAEGFTLTSSTTYHFDPATDAVTVESTYLMTNTTRDRRSGNRIEFYYFEGTAVPVHAGARNLVVEVNGSIAEYVLHPETEFTMVEIEFADNLRYGRTATIVVRYDLLGDPPRTETSWVRVNPAYVSFPMIAFADPGGADVRVEIPEQWTPEYSGNTLSHKVQDDTLVLEALDIETPDEFYVLFTARQDELLVSTPLTVAGSDFELRAWPGDTRWGQFAERYVTDGLPVLERLTGTPWPERNETDVIEASTPYLRGYAGYYYADTDVIEVTEDLDGHTMLHELSHAWFNDSYLTDRWLSEGLADEVGSRAVAELGDKLPRPDDYDVPPDFDASQFRLNDWDQPTSALDDASETYGYQTSFRVMRELSDEIGEEKMSALIAAVLGGDRAYGPEDGEPIDAGSVGWRQFLDLSEQIGGSKELVEDYRQHVVTSGQERDLDTRQDTLEAYAELVARGGSWAPPEAVREPMADWQFQSATNAIEDAEAALDVRDDLSEELSHVDLAPTAAIEDEYQSAAELEPVVATLTEQLAAARRIVAARAALTEQLGRLGLDTPDLTQSEYEEAPLGSAADTELLAERAEELVEAETDLDNTLAVFALSVPDLAPDAFAESPEEAAATLDAYQEAADAVIEAHLARESAGSFLQRIGEFGSHADERLQTADAELAAGDTTAAIDAARSASAAVSDWEGRGRTRITTAVWIVAGILLVILLLMVLRRRRRARRATVVIGDGVAVTEDDPTTELRQTWPDDGFDLRPGERIVAVDDAGHDEAAGAAPDPADARQVGALDTDR
jgi:hypothetical protein